MHRAASTEQDAGPRGGVTGRVALVSGGTRGMGAVISAQLAAQEAATHEAVRGRGAQASIHQATWANGKLLGASARFVLADAPGEYVHQR